MGKRTIINVLSYLAMIILLVIVFGVFIRKNEIELLCRIDIFSFAVLIGFTIVFYMVGGLQYYALRDMYGINLEKKDILLLPVAMNLWSFIIPLQGSAVFFMLFLKHRHKVKISDGLSITIFLYLVTIFFAGLVGIVFAIIYNLTFSLFSLISLIFLLNPLFVMIGHKIVSRMPEVKIKFIASVINFFKETVSNMNKMWLNYKYVAVSLLLIVCRMLVSTFWYMWIVRILGYHDVPFLSLLLLALWLTVSLIVRFTPNNWGVLQLISGMMFSLIALSPDQGIMISLVASGTLTIVAFTLGAAANFYYLRSWHIKSFKEVYKGG